MFYSNRKLKLFSGNANPGLAKEIAQYLGSPWSCKGGTFQ